MESNLAIGLYFLHACTLSLDDLEQLILQRQKEKEDMHIMEQHSFARNILFEDCIKEKKKENEGYQLTFNWKFFTNIILCCFF